MMQNGRLVDASGSNAYLDPLRSLESAGPQPPYLLAHGKTDISVINNDPFATRKRINKSSGSLQYSWEVGQQAERSTARRAAPLCRSQMRPHIWQRVHFRHTLDERARRFCRKILAKRQQEIKLTAVWKYECHVWIMSAQGSLLVSRCIERQQNLSDSSY